MNEHKNYAFCKGDLVKYKNGLYGEKFGSGIILQVYQNLVIKVYFLKPKRIITDLSQYFIKF